MKEDKRKLRLIDLTGRQFGKLTVISRAPENIRGKPAWVCQCECGNTKTIAGSALKSGQKSCGCMQGIPLNRISDLHKNPLLRKSHNNKLYNQWASMISRCTKPSATHYQYYGGNGISFCKEWSDFICFATWAINNGYKNNLELDRINTTLNYCPQNCRFVTHKKNSRNRTARRNSKSGQPGVIWRPSKTGIGGAWRVGIMVDGKQINLGTYQDLEDAIRKRKAAELKYWGFIANQ